MPTIESLENRGTNDVPFGFVYFTDTVRLGYSELTVCELCAQYVVWDDVAEFVHGTKSGSIFCDPDDNDSNVVSVSRRIYVWQANWGTARSIHYDMARDHIQTLIGDRFRVIVGDPPRINARAADLT